MKKKNLLFITGSRGEWGYIRPILKQLNSNEKFEYNICATNMHLLPSFGESVNEIEKDGFRVKYKINMSIDGYNHYTQIKSLGVFLMSLSDIIASEKPDWIILAGDRGEQLMAAIAGAYTYIPVLHIQAGEKSGNIDGMARHAIGKFAHVHIASNKDAYNRLIKLGEQNFRIFNFGAPQLDELVEHQFSSKEELSENLKFNPNENFILFVQHPVTEEFDKAEQQIQVTLKALNRFDENKVVILPNNDAGSLKIREGIEKNLNGNCFIFSNVKRKDYLGLLYYCKAIIGNSSSGILEAPTFNTPAVNIGRRQYGREQGINVINCDFNEKEIYSSIEKATSDDFKNYLIKNCTNPYGDGKSSKKIIELLENIDIDEQLIIKDITY
jgi:GDP/UDP-N,N'-diacetylbacillosamine 2-epimerase (hydrolysing)